MGIAGGRHGDGALGGGEGPGDGNGVGDCGFQPQRSIAVGPGLIYQEGVGACRDAEAGNDQGRSGSDGGSGLGLTADIEPEGIGLIGQGIDGASVIGVAPRSSVMVRSVKAVDPELTIFRIKVTVSPG